MMSSEETKKIRVTRREIIRFALHYWSYEKLRGGLAFLLLGLSAGVDVLYPVYSGKLVDKISALDPFQDGSLTIVLWAFAALMGIQIIHSWTWNAAFWFWNKGSAHVYAQLLRASFSKVQRFSTDWHVNSFAGATVRKITRGVAALESFSDTILMGLFPATIVGAGMVVMLIIQVPTVGWFALPMVALFVGASIFLAVRVMRPRLQKVAEQDTLIGATLADIMTALPTVKSFAGEIREDGYFGGIANEWRARAQRAWLTLVLVDVVRNHIRIVLMTGMLGFVIWLWGRGEATPGDVVLSITSFFIISGYLRDVGRQTAELMRSSADMGDAVSFWLREDEVQDAAEAKPLVIANRRGATIEFDRVGFCYQQGGRPIYTDLSVTIAAGEKVALVGASGSGKSTFVKLVQRLYDIQSGEIRIDGQNIAKVTQDSLRHAISLVPQDPILFHRSLAENIAYGRPDATMDEIRNAAQEAYAAQFIEGLSLGYDTLVGERGIKLSGGERQRVAIARALLADCPVLILDEATSSLDSVSEHYIQKALGSLMEGRTTITIAHRLATIRKADRILVFESGRIVEQGTHDALLRQADSVYKRLYDIQALDLVD